MANPRDDEILAKILGGIDAVAPAKAPSRLKARIYSALLQEQTRTAPLLSLSKNRAEGRRLCVFEQLVQIAPVGETAKSLNLCRVCHARVLAEHFENPPIYWPGCPYVALKKA
jgi:hypothetical protein